MLIRIVKRTSSLSCNGVGCLHDMFRHALPIALYVLIVLVPGVASAESDSLWDTLRKPGHVALIRHAIAPGTGDPSNFNVQDCQTQRNLSDTGREQAERIGSRFKASGMPNARVFSSQWCRCRDTANLLGLGPVEDLPILNSFFEKYENREKQTEALSGWLSGQIREVPLVLVTHQVNITALTGFYPASGEIVIIRQSDAGEISVIGSIKTD